MFCIAECEANDDEYQVGTIETIETIAMIKTNCFQATTYGTRALALVQDYLGKDVATQFLACNRMLSVQQSIIGRYGKGHSVKAECRHCNVEVDGDAYEHHLHEH